MAVSDTRQPVLAPPVTRPTLASRVPPGGTKDPAEILSLFLQWIEDVGFDPYPAQEEALLELIEGKHVILSTPTGSGKSLVALGLHFKALCEGRRCYYTCPIKALAEREVLRPVRRPRRRERRHADRRRLDQPARPRSSAARRRCSSTWRCALGDRVDAPYVVMDEFHYYADPERGVAWQVPLISLPRTQFLLMSATLGDMTHDRGAPAARRPSASRSR